MKMLTQYVAAVKRVSFVPGIIRNGMENKAANIVMPFYRTMHPHLKSNVRICLSYLRKDTAELEIV